MKKEEEEEKEERRRRGFRLKLRSGDRSTKIIV